VLGAVGRRIVDRLGVMAVTRGVRSFEQRATAGQARQQDRGHLVAAPVVPGWRGAAGGQIVSAEHGPRGGDASVGEGAASPTAVQDCECRRGQGVNFIHPDAGSEDFRAGPKTGEHSLEEVAGPENTGHANRAVVVGVEVTGS
jgi:hypothetical protein